VISSGSIGPVENSGVNGIIEKIIKLYNDVYLEIIRVYNDFMDKMSDKKNIG